VWNLLADHGSIPIDADRGPRDGARPPRLVQRFVDAIDSLARNSYL